MLSPLLFLVYIDELLLALKKSCHGCYIGNIYCGALGYADDVVLLAPTCSTLTQMLNVCEQFADRYNVLFNPAKSKLICLKSQSNITNCTRCFNFMGGRIEAVNSDLHLGNIVGSVSHDEIMNNAINDFVVKFNMVYTHFAKAPFYVKYKLFKTYCMPLYGAQLWDFSIPKYRTVLYHVA